MSFCARLWARLLHRQTPTAISPRTTSDHLPADSGPRIFVVVEGRHDIEFLRRISAMLHTHDARLPDLGAMERRGELIFIPLGGDPRLWTYRLAGLGRREFHLYDRETLPETESRQQAADVVNLRPQCRAVLTKKRNLENYLHPEAIFEAGGAKLDYSDRDHVAELIARHCYARLNTQDSWNDLPTRTRRRRRNRVKKWLNTRAVERMTPKRLAEQDPEGEVRCWLATIARLAGGLP